MGLAGMLCENNNSSTSVPCKLPQRTLYVHVDNRYNYTTLHLIALTNYYDVIS